jgi:hypothetical protein
MGSSKAESGAKRTPLGVTVLFTAVAIVAAIMAAGCSSPRSSPRGSTVVRPVERLDLLLTPVALDLDGRPGADGFGVRVYASNRQSTFGNRILEGTLEILMYDGTVRTDGLATATPLRTWRYPASELKPYSQKTSIGLSYRFGLRWGEQIPRGARITVVARYEGPDKYVVMSAPGAISIPVK